MWLHGCFTHITAPVRADRYTPLEESKHIVGLAHLRVHVPAHMCCSLSRAAKCLRQASLMPILICQSDLASYHFFPSAYFASYWRALTPKESLNEALRIDYRRSSLSHRAFFLSIALYSLCRSKALCASVLELDLGDGSAGVGTLVAKVLP